MHPTRTKIVYCQEGKRKAKYPNIKFEGGEQDGAEDLGTIIVWSKKRPPNQAASSNGDFNNCNRSSNGLRSDP
jgi:hypothetical protein